MPQLRRLTAEDEAAVLRFEVENRAYFARTISDRGDAFFQRFSDHHHALLADQHAGVSVFHVLIDEHGHVVGRVNLYEVNAGHAELGYRIAERMTGRGVATAAVEQLATVARDAYGLRALSARVSDDNVGSQRVLQKAGFVPTGPTEIGGRPVTRYRLELTGTAG